MDAFVFDEIAGCDKRFVAPVNWTGIGPFPCMNAFVFDEIAGCDKRFVAPV
ncbi:hypothetical protein [Sansalvadorimonas verongulae]|uniref:hypothetical protein n=1 Tax=Sansalvadorimonas verongulae TaxID=2172824 RepID=UPI0012BB7D5A|nr:hypothetical protein [Sansalvadorimonas verongulae]